MSLTRTIFRVATVEALRGRTFLGANVRDSEINAVDPLEENETRPYAVVYTDDAQGETATHDLAGMFAGGTVTLTIEALVTTGMEPTGANTDGDAWVIPTTDQGLELTIDLIEAEIKRALVTPSPWSDIWQQMALQVGPWSSQRGTWRREGIRAAGRQFALPVELPPDPRPDATEPHGVWARWLELAEATPHRVELAAMLRGLAFRGEQLAEVDRVRALTGTSDTTAAALLMTEG